MADDESIDLSDIPGESSFGDSSQLSMEDLGSASESGVDRVAVDGMSDASDASQAKDSGSGDDDGGFVLPKRKGLLSNVTIFDGMLLCALLLVTAAAFRMAWGLNEYGGIFELPWKTSGITVK